MVVCSFNLVAVATIAKIIGNDISASQSGFLRYLIGLIFIIPLLRHFNLKTIPKNDLIIFSIRGFVHSIGVMLWFFSMTQITIAEVISMSYLTPILLSIMAIIFLGEELSWNRIITLLCGIIGCLVILRPGFRELVIGHWSILGTVCAFSVSYLLTKQLTNRYSAEVIIVMLSLTCTTFLFPTALLAWKPPTLENIFWLFLVAFFATFAHYSMTRAFNAAPITVTQPFNFLQLIGAVAIGALFFSEPLDVWVFLGGGIIVGAISLLAWREFMSKRF